MSKSQQTAKPAIKVVRGFRVVFDVFGVYTWGRRAGQVNKNAHCTMVFFGDSYKACEKKLRDATDATFVPRVVTNFDLEDMKAAKS